MSFAARSLMQKSQVIFVLLLALTLLREAQNAPSRRRQSRRRRDRYVSTKRSRALEDTLRLGIGKSGVAEWNVVNPYRAARIRSHAHAPTELAAVRPQLNGRMGNNDAPKRLKAKRQFHPKHYEAPDRTVRAAPARLATLTEKQKNDISTEFFIKYGYVNVSNNAYTDRVDLIREMQRNYGLPVTGEMDEPTVIAMASPRCGVPDGPAEYNLFPSRQRWQSMDVTYTIQGYSPDMSQCQTRNALKRAFRVWEEVTDLTFEMVDRDDADIIIYFGHDEHGDGYPFDGSNGLLAHAFNPGTAAISGDSHFDEGEFWTLGKGRVFDTFNGNSGGEPCVFPFYFQNEEYNTCTSAGRDDGLEWCATTDDFDRDQRFAYCPHELLFTYGGNADNDPCVFPFRFQSNDYTECTYEGRSDGYAWCATSPNYDDDGRWGFCPSRAHGTSRGNAGGASCAFPFNFQGNSYSQCTTVGRSDYMLWCATTADYDVDGKWGFCEGDGYSLFLVAAHEFGHAIGMDHSSVSGALMYPTYSYSADFNLPDDDTRGARDLYDGARTKPLPPLRLESCGGDLTVTETATTRRPPVTNKSTRPSSRTTTAPPVVNDCDRSRPARICDRGIDSVITYQNDYYVFQGAWLWVVSGRGKTQTQTLSRVASYWRELKCGIDAGYQRQSDAMLMFFKGSKYYLFEGRRVVEGYPKSVATLGLPPRTKVDDVVFMRTRDPVSRRKQTRMYYFVGEKVYRADPDSGQVRTDLEPSILGETPAWRDVPRDLDAVFRESLAKPYTIFLKGKKYHRYNNYQGRLDYANRNIKKIFRCNGNQSPAIALPLLERPS